MADPGAVFAQSLQSGIQSGLNIAQLQQQKQQFEQKMGFEEQQAAIVNDIRRQQLSLEQGKTAASIGLIDLQMKKEQAQTELANWSIQQAKELPSVQAAIQQAIAQTWQSNKDPQASNLS